MAVERQRRSGNRCAEARSERGNRASRRSRSARKSYSHHTPAPASRLSHILPPRFLRSHSSSLRGPHRRRRCRRRRSRRHRRRRRRRGTLTAPTIRTAALMARRRGRGGFEPPPPPRSDASAGGAADATTAQRRGQPALARSLALPPPPDPVRCRSRKRAISSQRSQTTCPQLPWFRRSSPSGERHKAACPPRRHSGAVREACPASPHRKGGGRAQSGASIFGAAIDAAAPATTERSPPPITRCRRAAGCAK